MSFFFPFRGFFKRFHFLVVFAFVFLIFWRTFLSLPLILCLSLVLLYFSPWLLCHDDASSCLIWNIDLPKCILWSPLQKTKTSYLNPTEISKQTIKNQIQITHLKKALDNEEYEHIFTFRTYTRLLLKKPTCICDCH